MKKYPYNMPYHPCYFHSTMRYDLIKIDFLVNLKSADSLAQIPHQAIFKKVRRMTAFFASLPDYNVLTNFYNHFEKLEDLTFDSKYDRTLYMGKIVLELKSLKKFATYSDKFKYYFKTPSLKSLKMLKKRNRNSFFEFPESLEFLEVNECWEGPEFPKSFTNLKTLVVHEDFVIYEVKNFLKNLRLSDSKRALHQL